MNPEFQRTLAPYAAVIFKSKLSFYPTANLLSKRLFAGIYFGGDEWSEFGTFVRLLEPFIGFTVQLWPPNKKLDEHILLRLIGETVSITSDTNFDLRLDWQELLEKMEHDLLPDPEYEAARRSLDLSWYIARQLANLEEIYAIQESQF